MSRLDSLGSLLIRIQAKIETRSRRPWFDLQRTYYYDHTKTAINSLHELKIALEHFHVLLSEAELAQLYAAFPMAGTEHGFDFHAFASRCYPQDQSRGKIVEGRLEPSASNSSPSSSQQFQQTQQPQSQTQTQQFSPNSSFNASGSQSYSQSLSPQQSQQFSPQRSQQQQQAPPPQQFQSQSFNGSGSGGSQIPVVYDPQPAPAAVYNSTLYASASAGGGATQGRTRSRSRSPSKFAARLTYNRPLHGRFVAVGFVEGVGVAVPQPAPYPPQELKSAMPASKPLPRFEHKPLNPPLVEVPRRHNISRQYNREGNAAQKK